MISGIRYPPHFQSSSHLLDWNGLRNDLNGGERDMFQLHSNTVVAICLKDLVEELSAHDEMFYVYREQRYVTVARG